VTFVGLRKKTRMQHNKLEKLTEKEREVLRLVNRRLTSKEIAPLLGIRPDAVDARIKNATRKLGLPDRGKAAMLLADFEAAETYQQQVCQPPEVVAQSDFASLAGPTATLAREVQEPFLASVPTVAGITTPVSPEEGRRNELGAWQRVAMIAAVAIGTIVALGVLVSALNGLVQLALSRGRFF
jgi:DNA-binding CsgD family transcriptional regulator